MSSAKVVLDRIDRKLLNLLQQSSQVSVQQLADKVGISQPACHRRIRRLRDNGVIIGDVSVVSRAHAERKMAIWVEISLSSHQLNLFNELLDVLRASPYISSCDVITGDTDILACVNVTDMDEFREVSREFMRRCPIIKTYRSITVAQHIKLQPIHLFDEN
ncbi:Lrp/AsnC family transcriptional regulator [Rhizobium sp. KVB221]|uniref:Lrp/AsnC family transcriptional regulator n=1 Tax=Rhizobium setariae TaxID=2801340 RepID=A0A937CNG1_9HYPH|nr:Lrp/AsnC family transcriptional regulator [Rhizobium setariae]MBL0375455.1 Lrp/AsnC family transcriptional regulator [Rhizobium setariae]